MGAGVQGGMYPDFKPFPYEAIQKHLALYILQGLNPLPQVEQKFTSQANDPVQGNDLCFHVFGSNAVCCHHHFKVFFCIQDPTKKVPCRKEHPAFKVAPFLCHVQEVSMLAWHLGHDISGMNRQLASKGSILINCVLRTRQREMGFNVMLCAKVGSHGHFIFTINWHRQNTYNKASLHCTHTFMECLTSWMRNIGLTICQVLQGCLQTPKCSMDSWTNQKEWVWASQMCSSRGSEGLSRTQACVRNCKGCHFGGRCRYSWFSHCVLL